MTTEQKTDATDATENASVTVEWDDKGLHIRTGGAGLTPDQLILASHYLRRTADQLLDTQAMQALPQGIERVASIPDNLRSIAKGLRS